jgi:dihydroorotate dehydrogenase
LTAYSLVRPLLYKFDAERMHNLALNGLAVVSRVEPLTAALARLYQCEDPRLRVELFGKAFANPIGVAAGLDKNGVGVPALLALGFSFVEIGTVTPVSQPGNPKPRVFRLPEDGAVINRMGFPGAGVERVAANLERYHGRLGNLGCNIGPNKTSVANGTADQDCIAVLKRLHHLAAYLVVNVSSPNTAELRKLQGKEALRHLLEVVIAARPVVDPKPILVKISPDMTDRELDDVLGVISDVGLDGIVATNTTVSRTATLKGEHRNETGGLSGRPLQSRSLEVIRRISRFTEGKLPIIAAGGIATGADAIAAIQAGASLVQVYTGFIYRGPSAARLMKREMSKELDRLAITSVAEIRGSSAHL